jgi:hypothetical protein
MNCVKHVFDSRARSGAALALGLALGLAAQPVRAQTAAPGSPALPVSPAAAAAPRAQAPDPVWPETDTVLDLLRADARAALAAKRLERAQDWLAPSAASAASASAAASGAAANALPGAGRDRVDLLAIYGVGRSLHAEVSVNGVLWRYRQGRRWPQGISGEDVEPAYALAAIDPPCVRLRWQDAPARTVCLRGAEARHE